MEEGTGKDWRPIILVAFLAIAAVVVAVILIGRSGGGDSSSSASATGGCEEVEQPKPKHVSYKAPPQTVKKGEKLSAVVETSCGTFEIALDSARAPKTVNSFVFLSEKGFYDDLTFHRIAPGFVIQGGDPLGTGLGGPGYSVTEKPPANLSYTKGTVAMAKSSADPPGRSGSQFFVVTGADAGLPPEYALVGKVDKGFAIVKRIEKMAKPGTEEPKRPVLINRIRIEKG